MPYLFILSFSGKRFWVGAEEHGLLGWTFVKDSWTCLAWLKRSGEAGLALDGRTKACFTKDGFGAVVDFSFSSKRSMFCSIMFVRESMNFKSSLCFWQKCWARSAGSSASWTIITSLPPFGNSTVS